MPPKKSEQQKIAEFLAEYLLTIETMVAEAVEKILREKYGELLKLIEERAKPGPKGDPGTPGVSGKVIVEKNLKEKETVVLQPIISKEIPPQYSSPVFTPEDIKQKLIELPVKEEWFKAEHILGLRNLIQGLIPSFPYRVGGGGGDTVRAEDLSSQLDGSATAFTLTSRANRVLMLVSTQAPIIFRPTVDFTASDTGSNQTTITIDSSIPAMQSGQSLIALFTQA